MRERRWPFDLLSSVVLLMLPVVLFAPVLLSGLAELIGAPGQDVQKLFYPWRAYGFSALRAGAIPLWNPYVLCGLPFAAGTETALFYPPNWLFVLMPTWLALNVSVLLHVFLAGVFTYLWVRVLRLPWWAALLAAVSYQFAAPHILRAYAGNVSVACSAAWMPLVFLCAERLALKGSVANVLLTALALAMQVLAGHPQTVAYTVGIGAVYFLARWAVHLRERRWHQWAWSLAGAGASLAAAAALCAVQLCPAAELTAQSIRAPGLTQEEAGTFSLPPEALASFLVPEFFGNEGVAPYWGRCNMWEMTAYAGVLPLALAVLALLRRRPRGVWALAVPAAVALLLALGKYTPLFPILFRVLPGYGAFRGNSKFLLPLVLMLSGLAGYGLVALKGLMSGEEERRDRRVWWVALGLALLVAAGLLVVALAVIGSAQRWEGLLRAAVAMAEHHQVKPGMLTPELLERTAAVAWWSCWRAVLLMGAAVALLLALRWLRRGRWAIVAAALTIAALDGLTFARGYVRSVAEADCRWPAELVAAMREQEQPVRAGVWAYEWMNSGMADGVSSLGGSHPTPLLRTNLFYGASQGEPRTRRFLEMVVRERSRLTDLANVRFFVLPAGAPAPRGLAERGRAREHRIVESSSSRPRASVAYRFDVMDDDSALNALAEGAVDASATVILSESPELPDEQPAAARPACRIAAEQPQRVAIAASLERPGFVVLCDAYYPGWKCVARAPSGSSVLKTIRRLPVLRANTAFRAVALPPGDWVVEFYYDPLSFKAGAAATLAGLAAMTVAASALCWRKWGKGSGRTLDETPAAS